MCFFGLSEAGAQTAAAPAPGDPLAAGRALFAEALADEQAGRFAAALEKFQRVERIKETASIEYRIGTCYESLGRAPAAYGAYQAALTMAERDPAMSDVARASHERLDALSKHVARLTLALPDATPADASVRVDEQPVAREALSAPLVLEPGAHAVAADASGRVPFRSQIALPEGGEASLAIILATAPAAPQEPAAAAPAGATSARRTAGWIFLAAGGALLAGSATALVLRQVDITSLQTSCPSGLCPAGSNRSDLEATRNRALAEGPIAAGLGAGALAAAALGLYFVLSGPTAPAAARAVLAPALCGDKPGVTLEGAF